MHFLRVSRHLIFLSNQLTFFKSDTYSYIELTSKKSIEQKMYQNAQNCRKVVFRKKCGGV